MTVPGKDSMGEEKKGAAEEAKGLSKNLVDSLGLTEIILGGVMMYGLWLLFGTRISTLFPSTGISFIDIGLLAFGAAAVGKLIDLLVSALLAFGWMVNERAGLFAHYSTVRTSLEASGILDTNSKVNPLSAGVYYLGCEDTTQPLYFEQIRTRAVFAYSVSVLILPYLLYFLTKDVPTLVLLLIWGGAILSIVTGFLHQVDYCKTLAERLVTNVKIKAAKV